MSTTELILFGSLLFEAGFCCGGIVISLIQVPHWWHNRFATFRRKRNNDLSIIQVDKNGWNQ